MPVSDPDFDVCRFCKADGCESGTAVHADDCPNETGVFPVTEQDLGPRCPHCKALRGEWVGCCRCDTKMRLGDFYHHIQVDDFDGVPVYETVCAGCAAQEALS